MNLFKDLSKTELDCHSPNTFFPLPVSDGQSAARNITRRINASKTSATQFIQLEIIVSEIHQFKLTIAKTMSFEGLASIVEAEYSFNTGELMTCCIMASDDWDPFHLDWIIGNHLVNGNKVRVFSYTDVNRKEFGLERLNPNVISDQDFADLLFYILNDQELERKFYDFLIKSFSLENMFFFLDLHGFKTKSFSPEVNRVYLTLVYLMPNSPLSINLDSEIKRNILSSSTGLKGVDPSIFDDAFHEVCWTLKLVTDTFIKKYSVNELSSNSTKNSSFRINLKNTIHIVEALLTDSNVNIGKITDKSISGFVASAINLDKLAIDRYQILAKVQSRFFANKKELDAKSSYFFDNTTVDRTILIDKTTKLKKKFGTQPSQKDLYKQVTVISREINVSEEDLKSDDETGTKSTMVKKSNRLQSFFGENVAPHLINQGSPDPGPKKGYDELEGIRKKWNKLQHFLGENVPLKTMIMQRPNKPMSGIELQENQDAMLSIYQGTLRAMATAIEDSTQLVEILYTFSALDSIRENTVDPNPKRRISIEVQVEKGFKQVPSQSEKKIIKLENFFGKDIGVTALLRQIESQIVSDLESLIASDISNPEHQKILSSEIEKTRNKIHSKITALSGQCKVLEDS